MDLEYDLNDNYFKYYNEANGAVYYKKKLISGKNVKIKTYFQCIFINAFICFLIACIPFILAIFLKTYSDLYIRITSILIYTIILYLLLSIAIFIYGYKSSINSKKGILRINENGITDECENGNKYQVSYNNIDVIAVTKSLIVIITNSQLMILIKNTDKDKIINKIKSYCNVLVVDNYSK